MQRNPIETGVTIGAPLVIVTYWFEQVREMQG